MKKKFFLGSLPYIIVVLFCTIAIGFCVWWFCEGVFEIRENVSSFIFTRCLPLVLIASVSLYRIVSMITYFVCFYDDKIYVPNQKAFRHDRVQFETDILYSQIKDVSIKSSIMN